jgi:peptidoglycan hydrolase CwlO-like protein
MHVEILLLILIGVVSLGSYKIIKRHTLIESKINLLYETRHELRELHRHIQETHHRIEETHHRIEETRRELRHHIGEMQPHQQEMYEILRDTNQSVQQIHNSLQHIDFVGVNVLERRFDVLESMVMERVNHIDKLFENINLRFEYFNNRLHFINDKVEQSFPNRKTRLRKKINLTYKFRRP